MCCSGFTFFRKTLPQNYLDKDTTKRIYEFTRIYTYVWGNAEAAFNGRENLSAIATEFKYSGLAPYEVFSNEEEAFNAAKTKNTEKSFYILKLKVPDFKCINGKWYADLNEHLIKIRSFKANDKYSEAPSKGQEDPHHVKMKKIFITSENDMHFAIEAKKAAGKARAEQAQAHRQKVLDEQADNINTLNQPTQSNNVSPTLATNRIPPSINNIFDEYISSVRNPGTFTRRS